MAFTDLMIDSILFRTISDVIRFIKSPTKEIVLWRDFLSTWHSASFLRKHHWKITSGSTALAYCRNSTPYHLKLYAMLALALRFKGWDTLFVLNHRKDHRAKRYLNAFGFINLIYWSDYRLGTNERQACINDSKIFAKTSFSFSDVKDWTYRGCWIGPQILASISRITREGSPDPEQPETRQKILKLLPQTLTNVYLAEKMLSDISPDLVYLIEPNYAKNGPITDVAVQRNINFIQVAQIAKDDALMFRRLNKETRREHPSSISLETLEKVRQEPWTERQELDLQEEFDFRYGGKWFLQSRCQAEDAQDFSNSEIITQLNLNPNKKIAVVFSHVLWDANLFYGEDLFEDNGDWFVQTVKAACQNSNVNWIIKLHPANSWKNKRDGYTDELSEISLIKKHIGALPQHVKILYPDCKIKNTSLFKVIDYAITIRGTVSTELPCYGIPVFTAGTGRCYGLGFTVDSKSKEEYLDRLANIQNQEKLSEDAISLAKKHALTAFRRRPWPMKTFSSEFFQSTNGRPHPLDHNLQLTAHSIDEIHQNGDLERWAKWSINTALVDYLDY
jgi:hypothetical protein